MEIEPNEKPDDSKPQARSRFGPVSTVLDLSTAYKRLARKIGVEFNTLTGTSSREKSVRTLLQMPSTDMIDTRMAVKSGLINRSRTHCIFIERDPDRFASMQKRSAAIGFKCQPRLYNCAVEQFFLPNAHLRGYGLEFADLDFCSSPTGEIFRWMREVLSAVLTTQSVVCLTFCQNFRRNRFVPLFKEWLWDFGDGGGHLLDREAASMLAASRFCYQVERPDDFYGDPAAKIDGLPLYARHQPSSQIILAAVQAALFDFDFDVAACFAYPAAKTARQGGCGGSRMCRLRLHNFRDANYKLHWRRQRRQLDKALNL